MGTAISFETFSTFVLPVAKYQSAILGSNITLIHALDCLTKIMKQTSTNFKVKAYHCDNKWFMYMLECNKTDHDIFLPAKRSSEILNSVYFGLLL